MPKAITLLAPQALLRGVFCVLACLPLLISCDSEKRSTPDWETTLPSATPDPPSQKRSPRSQKSSNEEFILMVYNLRNYLNTHRPETTSASKRAKPEDEIEALIANIVKVAPHVLGVSEIGTRHDLVDLQKRLHQVGLNYRYTHLSEGADPRRRLAILSQLPLNIHPEPSIDYKMNGKKHLVSRGISDVSISTDRGEIRLIGVHLKSKRPSKYWDQELVRRHEAEVVRLHIESILQKADQRLILYGDFNDTKQSSTIRCLRGNKGSHYSLNLLDLRASDGTRWTHHWDYEDVYSRFDYVFTTTEMLRNVLQEKSYVLDLAPDDPASDHRPLVITFQ